MVNRKQLEDIAAYTENTTVGFTMDNNSPTIYYGSSGSFTGTLTSQASYVTLKLQGNLYHENGALVDNTQLLELTPGASVSFSLSHSPLQITDYTLRVYSSSGTLMWSRPARLNVKLQQPVSASPADLFGTTENVLTLGWAQVSGADNYVLQYSTFENFYTYQEQTLTENQLTTPELAENRWYWRVRAQGKNLVSADWLTRSFWVDRTPPTLDSFSGPSSTSLTSVTLTLSASDNLGQVYQVRFREGATWGSWQSYATSKGFTISSGDGTKTVEAQVRDRAGNLSNILSTSITLSTPTTPPPEAPPPSKPTPAPDTDPSALMLLTSIPAEVNTSNLSIQISVSDASPIGKITATLDGDPTTYSFANDVITISLDNLKDGPHAVVVRVSDSENNQSDRTISFSVKLPPMPVPIEENIPAESLRVENVPAGQQVKFTFAAEITSITLVTSENMWEAVLTLVRHENLSDTLPPFDNAKRPYRYFEITLRINGVENYVGLVGFFRFEFRVEKSWVENENITDVRLYRLVDNSWQPVSTRFIRDDFEYRYYEAEVLGLSIFSIVGIRTVGIAIPSSAPVTATGEGIPLAAMLASLLAIGGGIAGGVWYYMRYYVRRRMQKEFVARRELKEGP